MLYAILESFSPKDHEPWLYYCNWRGITFECFESIDGILRPSLFAPRSDADWAHVVNEDFKTHFITSAAFAEEKHREIGKGDLVGVRFEDHDEQDPRFLGYDLIDRFCNVSLLTNWGPGLEIIDRALSPAALISSLSVIRAVREELIRAAGDDPHVDGCTVVSVYRDRTKEKD